MAGAHGVAAQVFRALGAAGVNVRAIAQGASERNISVVIDGRSSARGAARRAFELLPLAAHDLDRPDRAGTRRQRAARADRSRRPSGCAATSRSTCGCARSPARSGCCSCRAAIDLARWRDEYAAGGDPMDLERFADHVHADHFPHAVIIDCSASAEVAEHYARLARRAASTSSRRTRRRTARAMATTNACKAARRAAGAHYLYEATVGAGLPVIQTLARPARDRRRDPPRRGHPLRHARVPVQHLGRQPVVLVDRAEAKALGLHRARSARRPLGHGRGPQADHPRPRDGPAASRWRTSRSRASCQRRLPNAASTISSIALPSSTRRCWRGCARRGRRGHVLRYVGSVDAQGRRRSASSSCRATHPFANIALTDNIVRFQTAATTRIRSSCRARAPAPPSPPPAYSRTCCGSARTSGPSCEFVPGTRPLHSHRPASATSPSVSTSSGTRSPRSATRCGSFAVPNRACRSCRFAAWSKTCRWRPRRTPRACP